MDIDVLNAAAEKALRKRLDALYSKAIRRIIRRTKALWAALRALDEGKEAPPETYDEAQRRRWVQARVEEALMQGDVESVLGTELAAAGLSAGAMIVSDMIESYSTNRAWVKGLIEEQIASARMTVAFRTLSERQIRIILEDSQPVGTRVAYRNLGASPTFVRRFQREMVQAVRLGESQRDLVGRIMDAMGETGKAARNRAELIAQTERTRVQSQARWEMEDEAQGQGIRMADIWLCQNIPPHKTSSGWSSGSRDSHRALHREARLHGQSWTTIHGHTLRYPGDPSAPPSEICRCHCALEPRVLLADEDVVDGKIIRRARDAGSV